MDMVAMVMEDLAALEVMVVLEQDRIQQMKLRDIFVQVPLSREYT